MKTEQKERKNYRVVCFFHLSSQKDIKQIPFRFISLSNEIMIMQDVAGQKTNLNIYTTRPEAVTLPRTFYRKEKVPKSVTLPETSYKKEEEEEEVSLNVLQKEKMRIRCFVELVFWIFWQLNFFSIIDPKNLVLIQICIWV